MNPSVKTIPMFSGITMTSAGTVFGSVDTKGFDYLVVSLAAGTGAAAQTAVTTLQLCESDTAPTAYTDGDAVTAFVGAAAVSTSAGFVLPALSSTKLNTFQFNVDLKGRKRYIGIDFAPTLQTVGVGCVAVLSKAADGAEIKTVATGTDGARLIVSG
jgi:hypothetical protein